MRIFLISFCVLFAAGEMAGAQDYVIPPLDDAAVKADFRMQDGQNVRMLTVRFKILRNADKELATEVEDGWIHVYENDKLVKKVKLVKKPIDLGLNIVMVLDTSGT